MYMKLVDKMEYMKAKIDELDTNRRPEISETCIGASMTLIRVTSLEYSKKGELLTESHSTLVWWRNHLSDTQCT